jgi:hypothetical protein
MSGKPYVLEERDGRQVRVYESGTVLDHISGKLVEPYRPQVMTPELAREMRARSAELNRLAKVRGIIRGVGLPMPSDEDVEALAKAEASAIEIIFAAATNNFLNSDSLRGKAEMLTKLTGGSAEEPPRGSTNNVLLVSHPADADTARKLERILRDAIKYAQEHPVIEAGEG